MNEFIITTSVNNEIIIITSDDNDLTEIGAVVLNFLPRSKILNRPTVSTHYRIQKYVKKICLHKLIVEIALFVYIFVKFRNRIIRVKKI